MKTLLMKKAIPYFLLLLVIAVFFFKQYRHNYSTAARDKRDFERHVSYLQYSNHAKCRMECRHITQEEVEKAMRDGEINYAKSDIQNPRCPRYALEDVTKDNQHVRIIFAQCNGYTEVVTVIDLDTEWTCDCPGDDDKYKNKN